MAIEKIIPVIVKKWSSVVGIDGNCEQVFIQQVNAGPHVIVDDATILVVSSSVTYLDIKIMH